MKITKFKIVTKNKTYPIIIGNNIIKRIDKYLSSEIKNCKKISLIIDNNIPKKNIYEIQKSLRKYPIFITYIKTNEKIKSILTVEKIVDNLLNKRRPVINQIGSKNIEDLFKKRKEFYSLADHKIECEKLTLNQISDKIIKLYENN